MAEFPFQLLIKQTSSKNKEESLSCTALLRSIPGRRKVYDALWNNKSVIVKVFSHKISSRRHLKREWEGLNKLTELELSSPKPLFYGKTEDGQPAVVVEKIADSSTVLDALQKTPEPAKKLDLLVLVCKELAKQHTKGVLQKDLHLGNFLLADDRVFLLDPGQMRFLRCEADRKIGISQLAMLANYLPDSDTASIEKLCQEYFSARGWHPGESDGALVKEQRTAYREGKIKKSLKKCLRTGKRYLRIEVRGRKIVGVFDRVFCRGAEPTDFIEQIDDLMDKGEILKDGNTCYVSRLMWNNKDIVVKRYNHKGFIHSLRHTIKRSRARQGWLHAHRLRMLQIPTPRPLAYIEHRKTGLVWQSYLVTEYVEGQKLYDFLRDSKISEEERSMMNQQIVKLLDKLGKYKITHGDLKHSNILIADNGPVITDLDAMKVHKWDWLYKANRTKDIAHFTNR
jgi:tRNA A-37 threonylcarbamoyl transferase component Bud32